MTDPTPAATARDALVRATERYSALARVWHDSRPTHTLPFERCVWSECQIERHDALIAALAAAEAPGRVAALEVEAACSDRGCLHYDDEEPPCVGHMPSICCAKLSASIGAAAVADYRDVTPALTAAALAEAMRATGGQVFEGGEAVPAAFYLPWAPAPRCVGEHDWETRHPGDLAVCRRCWTVESDATPATRDE